MEYYKSPKGSKTKKLENDTKQGELKANYSQPAIVAFTINT